VTALHWRARRSPASQTREQLPTAQYGEGRADRAVTKNRVGPLHRRDTPPAKALAIRLRCLEEQRSIDDPMRFCPAAVRSEVRRPPQPARWHCTHSGLLTLSRHHRSAAQQDVSPPRPAFASASRTGSPSRNRFSSCSKVLRMVLAVPFRLLSMTSRQSESSISRSGSSAGWLRWRQRCRSSRTSYQSRPQSAAMRQCRECPRAQCPRAARKRGSSLRFHPTLRATRPRIQLGRGGAMGHSDATLTKVSVIGARVIVAVVR
jgi:hypothetical protein